MYLGYHRCQDCRTRQYDLVGVDKKLGGSVIVCVDSNFRQVVGLDEQNDGVEKSREIIAQ